MSSPIPPLRSRLLADHVPLKDHIADDQVLTTTGGVMAIFAVEGVCPDTADQPDIVSWIQQHHQAILNIHGDDITLSVFQCHAEADLADFPAGVHRHEYAEQLDHAYRASLARNKLFVDEYFLAVEVNPSVLMTKSVARFLVDTAHDPAGGVEEHRRRLSEVCDLLSSQLGSYRPRRLGYVERNGVLFDEIAEALAFAMTGRRRQIGVTTGRMVNGLFTEHIKFNGSKRRLEFYGAGDPWYAALFAFKDPPESTGPNMFLGLVTGAYRSTLVQSFSLVSNADSVRLGEKAQNRRGVARDRARKQTAALDDLMEQLLNGECILGSHSWLLMVFADDEEGLGSAATAAWKDLASSGTSAIRLRKVLKAAYLSMFPGGHVERWRHKFWSPRPGYITSRNWVAFAPYYSWPAGPMRSHWSGPPIAIFVGQGRKPFRFFWHHQQIGVQPAGNTLFTGMPGGGKSFTAGFLLAMSSGRARIVALDYKRGWYRLSRGMGADYAVLGSGEPHLAPLKALSGSMADAEFLTDLIRGCIGGHITEEEGRRIALAVTIVMELPASERWMREVRAFLDDEPEGAGARLDKWCYGNELGWVIDAPEDTVRFQDVSFLDMTAVVDNERARGPTVATLFYRASLLLDGTPFLMFCDEGWRAMGIPIFAAMIERTVRIIRSKNGVLNFITQSPGDISGDLGRVLREMCPNQFHFANPRALEEDYLQANWMTKGEFDAFHMLQPGQGWFLLKQGDKSVLAQLPMHGVGLARALSASEEDLRHDNVVDLREAAE